MTFTIINVSSTLCPNAATLCAPTLPRGGLVLVNQIHVFCSEHRASSDIALCTAADAALRRRGEAGFGRGAQPLHLHSAAGNAGAVHARGPRGTASAVGGRRDGGGRNPRRAVTTAEHNSLRPRLRVVSAECSDGGRLRDSATAPAEAGVVGGIGTQGLADAPQRRPCVATVAAWQAMLGPAVCSSRARLASSNEPDI